MIEALLKLQIWFLQPRGDKPSDRGASLVEYAFLVALIAIVCLLAVLFLGDEANSSFDSSGSSVSAAN